MVIDAAIFTSGIEMELTENIQSNFCPVSSSVYQSRLYQELEIGATGS